LQFKKFHELKINELILNVVLIAKDNNGCRFLQQKMNEMPPNVIVNIFKQTIPNICELCNDAFGNFFIQKLIELLNVDNLSILLHSMQNHFLYISTNPYGTRVIQKLLEIDNVDIINILCKYMDKNMLDLFMNMNSIHIIQKTVTRLFPFSMFIYECIYSNMIIISLDKNGCCILQKCIESSRDKSKFMMIVLKNILLYMTDQYANYVLQYLVGLGDQVFINTIIRFIIHNLIIFSKHKYSSNVLEKVNLNNFRFSKIAMTIIDRF
jgi:hypothetical protein